MMNKVIFILVDALGLDAATKHCGFLEHMVEAGQGAKYRMIGELPSISRPMYETLLSGLPVWKHGITSNDTRRRSRVENNCTERLNCRSDCIVIASIWMAVVTSCTGFSTARTTIRMHICTQTVNICADSMLRIS